MFQQILSLALLLILPFQISADTWTRKPAPTQWVKKEVEEVADYDEAPEYAFEEAPAPPAYQYEEGEECCEEECCYVYPSVRRSRYATLWSYAAPVAVAAVAAGGGVALATSNSSGSRVDSTRNLRFEGVNESLGVFTLTVELPNAQFYNLALPSMGSSLGPAIPDPVTGTYDFEVPGTFTTPPTVTVNVLIDDVVVDTINLAGNPPQGSYNLTP